MFWALKVHKHYYSVANSIGDKLHCIFVCSDPCILCLSASGEPPLCMSCSLLFAVKRAIESARADAGNTDLFPLGELIGLLTA